MNESPSTREIKAVRNTFQIIDILMKRDGTQVTELADELDLAKSTVHQHLATLCNEGYAIKEDGKYYVGLRFLSIGEYARERHEGYRLAKPLVQQLVDETDERAQFFVEEHRRAIYLYTEAGERAVTANRQTGELRYLHSIAGGKAILAYMDQSDVEDVLKKMGIAKGDGTYHYRSRRTIQRVRSGS